MENVEALLDAVSFSREDMLYVLGDVIDRGKGSIELLKWVKRNPRVKLIRGNHEEMLLRCDFLFEEITEKSVAALEGEQLDDYLLWISNGGDITLKGLFATRRSEIKYLVEYLRETPLYECVKAGGREFILTHSGLGNFDRKKDISEYTADELLWTRPRLDTKYFDDRTVVFGHTPTALYGSMYRGKIIKTETWVNVDVGAATYEKPALLRLDDMAEFYL